MADSSIDRVKDRIRKLLALAENDGAAQGEIDNAMAFAAALMAEHHVTREEAHATAGAEERREYGYGESYTTGANLSTWESALGHAISELCGVKWYVNRNCVRKVEDRTVFGSDGKIQYAARLTWYGETGDCQEAEQLYSEWARTIASMARIRYGGALRGAGASYAYGFATALRDSIRKTPEAATGNALAVRSREIVIQKHSAASRWLANQGVKLGASSSRRVSIADGGAYGAGRADGAKGGLSRRGRIGSGSVRGLMA